MSVSKCLSQRGHQRPVSLSCLEPTIPSAQWKPSIIPSISSPGGTKSNLSQKQHGSQFSVTMTAYLRFSSGKVHLDRSMEGSNPQAVGLLEWVFGEITCPSENAEAHCLLYTRKQNRSRKGLRFHSPSKACPIFPKNNPSAPLFLRVSHPPQSVTLRSSRCKPEHGVTTGGNVGTRTDKRVDKAGPEPNHGV